MITRIAGAFLLLAMSAGEARAQDVSIGWNLAADNAMQGIHQDVLESSLGIGQRRGSGQSLVSRPAPLTSVARNAARDSFAYASSPAAAKHAVAGYIARASRTEPAAAKQLDAQLAQHDYRTVYRALLQGTGLRENDAVDALTAYTSRGWMIANNQLRDLDPSILQGLRGQIAARATGNPAFAPSRRAALGEEMKLLFVTLHAGWQSAQREGKLAQYSNGVAELFRRNDIDLRALRLTSSGFAAR